MWWHTTVELYVHCGTFKNVYGFLFITVFVAGICNNNNNDNNDNDNSNNNSGDIDNINKSSNNDNCNNNSNIDNEAMLIRTCFFFDSPKIKKKKHKKHKSEYKLCKMDVYYSQLSQDRVNTD